MESFALSLAASQAAAIDDGELDGKTFASYLKQIADGAPQLAACEPESHEIQLCRNLLDGWSRGDPAEVLIARVLSLLGTLIARDDPSQSPYGGLAVDKNSLEDYPINLMTLRQRAHKWRAMTLPDALSDLVAWCLNTHLRVALRKLRQTGRSTFHLRPSERGLEVVGAEIPQPAPTSPRFTPAVQILRDIGALTRDATTPNRQTRLTPAGRGLMEAACV